MIELLPIKKQSVVRKMMSYDKMQAANFMTTDFFDH